MEQVTPTESDQPTVQQMFATLMGEIATLRRQNEDQQRQLDDLRSATSLLLERDSVSPQTLGNKTQFKHLPAEIREMIWELAMPCRLLRFEDNLNEGETGVPLTLSVPAVANVCRESRRVFAARKHFTRTSGGGLHPETPTRWHLWRLKRDRLARWTSFRPHTDTLLIDPREFLRRDFHINNSLTRVAEHIVVDSIAMWRQFRDFGVGYEDKKALTSWVEDLMAVPENYPSKEAPVLIRAPVCQIRTLDFAMDSLTKVDRNYPANLVHRLFGEDSVKIVDLRNQEAVNAIERMIEDEISQVMERTGCFAMPRDLRQSLDIFKETAADIFPLVKSSLLRTLVRSYYESAIDYDESFMGNEGREAHLPPPFRDGQLDMEVTWVKDLCKRIDVRPVHVFVRTEGISPVNW